MPIGSPEETAERSRKERVMTTYIMLAKWTDQGIRHADESPMRLDKAKDLLKSLGGEFKHFYLTMGSYDMVAVYEAPDDTVAARFNLQLGMFGFIRTQTMKAFAEPAYRELMRTID
jgi:uncharacterized protein with GYD domain